MFQYLAGLLPHREAAGRVREKCGRNTLELLNDKLDALLLFGLEPDKDFAAGRDVVENLSQHRFVVAFTPYKTYALETCADLLLPIGSFAETSGTYVNCEGRWQSFGGAANPVGEARPGWKVLRVLANLLDVTDSDYQTSIEVRDELREIVGNVEPDNSTRMEKAVSKPNGTTPADGSVPMYEVDSIVRRAVALQLTPEARRSRGNAA